MKDLASRLDAARLRRDVPLAPYTTFRIGGPADLLYEADSAEDLARAVLAARETRTPYFVLGLGANILVGDRGFRGIVIRNVGARVDWSAEGHVTAESGAIMRDLILESVRRGWSGFEHFVGIPSTVGGAVWQNLHFLSPAPERERTVFLAEVVQDCDILSAENARRTVDASYVKFGYDDSVFHHREDVVLRARFALRRGDPVAMQRVLRRTSRGAAPDIPGSSGIRARAPSSRRSPARAPAASWISAGSRDIAWATRRSRISTPTSS